MRVRIVSTGGTGLGTKVLNADTGEEIGLRIRSATIGRIDPTSHVVALLEVYVDEVDIEADAVPTAICPACLQGCDIEELARLGALRNVEQPA